MKYIRILIILVSLSYVMLPFFLFPMRLPPEILVRDMWVTPEDVRASQIIAPETWVALPLGEDILFVSDSGQVGHRESRDFYWEYDDRGLINTSQYHSTLIRRSPPGDVLETVETRGFPIFAGDGLLTIDPDGLGLRAYDNVRELLFSRRWSSPVSAAQKFENDMPLYLISLLDGRVFVFNEGGETLASWTTGGNSAHPISYGARMGILRATEEQASDRVVVAVLGGFRPMTLGIVEFVPFGETQGSLRMIGELELDFQLISPAAINLVSDADGSLRISVSSPEGSFLASFFPETVGNEGRIEGGVLLPSSVRVAAGSPESPAGVDWTVLQGPQQSGLVIHHRNTRHELLRRQLPFDARIEWRGDRIFIRGSGLLSSFILEEG